MKKTFLFFVALALLTACNQNDTTNNEIDKLKKEQKQLKDKYEELLTTVIDINDCFADIKKTNDRIGYYILNFDADTQNLDSISLTLDGYFQNMSENLEDNDKNIQLLEKKLNDDQLKSKQLKKMIELFQTKQDYDKEQMAELRKFWDDKLKQEYEQMEYLNLDSLQFEQIDSII